MTEPHPELGEQVHYYDPELLRRAGFGRGHGTPGMGIGPYLAIVVNPLPSAMLQVQLFLPDTPPHPVKLRHKDSVASPKDPYWDWASPLQKARAVKRQPAEPEPAPERNRNRHPGAPVPA